MENQCFIYIRRLDNILILISSFWHWILRTGILKTNCINSGLPSFSQTVTCPLARLYNLTLLFSHYLLIKLIKIQKLLVNFSCTWGIWLHILMTCSQNVLMKLHILLICCDISLTTALLTQGPGWCELHPGILEWMLHVLNELCCSMKMLVCSLLIDLNNNHL